MQPINGQLSIQSEGPSQFKIISRKDFNFGCNIDARPRSNSFQNHLIPTNTENYQIIEHGTYIEANQNSKWLVYGFIRLFWSNSQSKSGAIWTIKYIPVVIKELCLLFTVSETAFYDFTFEKSVVHIGCSKTLANDILSRLSVLGVKRYKVFYDNRPYITIKTKDIKGWCNEHLLYTDTQTRKFMHIRHRQVLMISRTCDNEIDMEEINLSVITAHENWDFDRSPKFLSN